MITGFAVTMIIAMAALNLALGNTVLALCMLAVAAVLLWQERPHDHERRQR